MYISYTHFRVNNPVGWFIFQVHAFRSGHQVSKSRGLVKWTAWAATYRDFCTVSVWNSRREMVAFMTSGAHLKAMKLSKYMGKGYAVGWESIDLGSNPDLHALKLEGKGRLQNKLELRQLGDWLPA